MRGMPQAIAWYAALQLLYGCPRARPTRSGSALARKVRRAGRGRPLTTLWELSSAPAGRSYELRGVVAFLEQAAERGNARRAMWQLAWQTALVAAPCTTRRARAVVSAPPPSASTSRATSGSAASATSRRAVHFASGSARSSASPSGAPSAGGLLAPLLRGHRRREYAAVLRARQDGRRVRLDRGDALLGWAYRQGDGVEAGPGAAAAWWRRARKAATRSA